MAELTWVVGYIPR